MDHNTLASKLVAIVVPLSNRVGFTPEEEVSLHHLLHYLRNYDKYFITPKSLQIKHKDFYIKSFSDKFFGSVAANCRLMLSPNFYKAFLEYKYILVYHLDSLVFSDQLEQWCQTDLDYIGPPWLNCPDSPWVHIPKVGNGGFSLRKVESFLKVLSSSRYCVDPDIYWQNFCASKSTLTQYMNFPRKYLKRLNMFNGVKWQTARWNPTKNKRNEDEFWSDAAQTYYPEFKVASFETGLHFAFEVAPKLCFELNHRTLPFGCHAWHKYDRAFWEPHLLKEVMSS